MKCIRWLFCALVMGTALAAGSAIAQTCTLWRVNFGGFVGDPSSDKDAAFSNWAAKVSAAQGHDPCGGDPMRYNPYSNVGTRSGDIVSITKTYSGCGGTTFGAGSTTQSGAGFLSEAGPCAEPQCAVQTVADATVRNVTVAYTRSPDSNTAVGTPFNPWAPGATSCDSKCVVAFGDAVSAWTSTSPTAQGLYRNSVDMKSYTTGVSCSGQSAELNSDASSAPSCPGAVGTVNGKTYCAGTAANPVSNDQPAPPSTIPPTPGNPTAGSAPTPGQDRTPATGGGGPEGGPRAGGGTVVLPSDGGNPSGTVTKPGEGTEQAECGAPGQPKCAIDESGTPNRSTADGEFAKARTESAKAETDAKAAIEAAKSLAAPGWSWSFAFPTGCTPMTLAAFNNMVLDVCQYQPVMHDIMSLCWIAATIFCCVGLAGRTLKGA